MSLSTHTTMFSWSLKLWDLNTKINQLYYEWYYIFKPVIIFNVNKVSVELQESLPWTGGSVYEIWITPGKLRYSRTITFIFYNSICFILRQRWNLYPSGFSPPFPAHFISHLHTPLSKAQAGLVHSSTMTCGTKILGQVFCHTSRSYTHRDYHWDVYCTRLILWVQQVFAFLSLFFWLLFLLSSGTFL